MTFSSMAGPLRIGPLTVDVPVILAPMAGITNAPFRRLCREYGGGIYVSEMVTSRALVERTEESMRIIQHHESESPRSVQLYGVDPATIAAAVRILVEEDRADHIDLNFGCPVPKVTRKGGGAVLPWKTELFAAIVGEAVDAAAPGNVPVTIKMRKGIDADHLTYLEAAKIAEGSGIAAIALHARTAAEYYSGNADWSAIAKLKESITSIPILGNGDIWSADDAIKMMAQTGCDGVVIGRGCQGRPWLFGDLERAMKGSSHRVRPSMREVTDVIRRHSELMVEFLGDENRAMREMRKHMSWYLKGYIVGGVLRAQLGLIDSLTHLDDLIATMDLDQPYPGEGAEGPRGRAGSPRVPVVPEKWLESRKVSAEHRQALHEAELSVSGG